MKDQLNMLVGRLLGGPWEAPDRLLGSSWVDSRRPTTQPKAFTHPHTACAHGVYTARSTDRLTVRPERVGSQL